MSRSGSEAGLPPLLEVRSLDKSFGPTRAPDISTVLQELSLCGTMAVAENIHVNSFLKGGAKP